MFTGREYLQEIELYDYRNRVYSAQLGRFLQPDPMRFDAGDANIYRYVSNDPVNGIDPYGLICWGKLGLGALEAAKGVASLSVAVGVPVGTAILTKSPVLTGVMVVLMAPVAGAGVLEIKSGVRTIKKAFDCE